MLPANFLIYLLTFAIVIVPWAHAGDSCDKFGDIGKGKSGEEAAPTENAPAKELLEQKPIYADDPEGYTQWVIENRILPTFKSYDDNEIDMLTLFILEENPAEKAKFRASNLHRYGGAFKFDQMALSMRERIRVAVRDELGADQRRRIAAKDEIRDALARNSYELTGDRRSEEEVAAEALAKTRAALGAEADAVGVSAPTVLRQSNRGRGGRTTTEPPIAARSTVGTEERTPADPLADAVAGDDSKVNMITRESYAQHESDFKEFATRLNFASLVSPEYATETVKEFDATQLTDRLQKVLNQIKTERPEWAAVIEKHLINGEAIPDRSLGEEARSTNSQVSRARSEISTRFVKSIKDDPPRCNIFTRGTAFARCR